MKALLSRQGQALKGRAVIPGDKSISHRALMMGLLSVGETQITGLLEGEDVLATSRAVAQLGAEVQRLKAGHWRLHGPGLGALKNPEQALDMGNSGTACRLLMGIAASHAITCRFTGDHSLSSRPMDRVIKPLEMMGAEIESVGGRLPLSLKGHAPALPIRYMLPVASAQVKSAILLAGLNTPGATTVIENASTRDHTERMLKGFGAEILIHETAQGREITVTGEAELKAVPVIVPGDPSSAAFAAVAATLIPGSEITLENIGMNPTRSGLYEVLRDMGAQIEERNPRDAAGEPVADLHIRAGALQGIDVDPAIAPRMIDEYPILAVAAACAQGTTRMSGIKELRVKETDRISAMAQGLMACGVKIEEGPDELIVHGRGIEGVKGGVTVKSHYDHRIAMSFAVLGQVSQQPITIDDASAIATSFPSFIDLMRELGAEFAIESDGTA